MASTELADRGGGEAPEPRVDLEASAALSEWLAAHPSAERELAEAGQARIHLQELDGRAQTAEVAATEAERHADGMTIKLDPAGLRRLPPAAGGALVALLIILDVLPLNWAAQAFGLDAAGSWLITGILLVASIAGMAAMEMAREHRRRQVLLAAALTIAGVAVVILRTEYLVTVVAERPAQALLQSVLLTAVSVGLILCGSVILGRTCPVRLARARSAARAARHAAAARRTDRTRAAERMQRHFGALRQMLIPWVLSSAPPSGVDHVAWTDAVERAVRGLFAGL